MPASANACSFADGVEKLEHLTPGMKLPGIVTNITKFGAFVNILPGRDGLLHISKIGGGKRIDRVEDVLDLGDEVEVRVDDVDPNGKVSLSLAQRQWWLM